MKKMKKQKRIRLPPESVNPSSVMTKIIIIIHLKTAKSII